MALSQSALNELLDAVRAGDGTDVLRDAGPLAHSEMLVVCMMGMETFCKIKYRSVPHS